jgi:chemotaxis signal transduction protein
MTGSIASPPADSRARLAGRATELRSAFDRSFALPLRVDTAVKQDLLAVRIGAEPCAIRLSEVSGLFADRGITPVPASNPALLGIAGFRGAVVPVYSLRSLLGQSGAQAPRWLVIAAAMPVALAFDAFEGHLRVPPDAIVPQQAAMGGCAREFVRSANAVRSVLHLPSVIEALGATERPDLVPMKEHGVRSDEHV